MARCPSCNAQLSQIGRFCPACGATLPSSDDTPTIAGEAPRADSITLTRSVVEAREAQREGRTRSSGPGRPAKSASSVDLDRFSPGTMLGDRYRLSERLGKGGMGEVYKAEDLKLGQPVALKFLPEHLAFNEDSLTRLFNEVKVARQVSHPNVCRVHDIGDVDGHHFISMEYVDGEDLASLLRRIGRLPPDKAVQIARQLCAGLAAAHDKGVLHRDLKPANVMIDGRGHVRITDFGLAGLAEELRATSGRAGTPAYMAPEQLGGRGVTTKSDIYALGLVLYEVFTGKPVYRPESLAQLQEMHGKPPPNLSSTLPDIDPRIERTILRCLERDPINRPNSAIAVSAGLPGANPLAEALAAGETPSPELVASSGSRGSLKLGVAAALLAVVIAGLVGVGLLNARHSLLSKVPLPMSPEVLTSEARRILKQAGLGEAGPVSARGFTADEAELARASAPPREDAEATSLSAGQPAVMTFWARWSPNELTPTNAGHVITDADPPVHGPGERLVELDTKGRLVRLVAPPAAALLASSSLTGGNSPAAAGSPASAMPAATSPDWAPLLEAAGLAPAALTPASSSFVPPVFGDARAAWTGVYPDAPARPFRVEAAAAAGSPTFFQIIPEPVPGHSAETRADPVEVAVFSLVMLGLIYVAPVAIAVRNLRRGRGDRKGALRFALVIFAGKLLAFMLGADLTWDLAFFAQAVGSALHHAALFWLVYMAVEPLIRRIFPQSMISWTRFVGGAAKDPLVGRDLLLGAVLGVVWLLLVQGVFFAASMQGTIAPRVIDLRPALSPLYAAGALLDAMMLAGIAPVFVALVFVLTRALIKLPALRTAVECFVLSVFFAVMMSAQVGERAATLGALVGFAFGCACAIIFARFGLLVLLSAFVTATVISRLPVVLGPPAWTSAMGVAAMVLIILGAGFGAWHAGKGGKRRTAPTLEQW